MQVKVNTKQRMVGSVKLLWNRLTPTRGARSVIKQLAATEGKILVSKRALFIDVDGPQKKYVLSSSAYARCLYDAGVREINLAAGMSNGQVRELLNVLSGRQLVAVRRIIGEGVLVEEELSSDNWATACRELNISVGIGTKLKTWILMHLGERGRDALAEVSSDPIVFLGFEAYSRDDRYPFCLTVAENTNLSPEALRVLAYVGSASLSLGAIGNQKIPLEAEILLRTHVDWLVRSSLSRSQRFSGDELRDLWNKSVELKSITWIDERLAENPQTPSDVLSEILAHKKVSFETIIKAAKHPMALTAAIIVGLNRVGQGDVRVYQAGLAIRKYKKSGRRVFVCTPPIRAAWILNIKEVLSVRSADRDQILKGISVSNPDLYAELMKPPV